MRHWLIRAGACLLALNFCTISIASAIDSRSFQSFFSNPPFSQLDNLSNQTNALITLANRTLLIAERLLPYLNTRNIPILSGQIDNENGMELKESKSRTLLRMPRFLNSIRNATLFRPRSSFRPLFNRENRTPGYPFIDVTARFLTTLINNTFSIPQIFLDRYINRIRNRMENVNRRSNPFLSLFNRSISSIFTSLLFPGGFQISLSQGSNDNTGRTVDTLSDENDLTTNDDIRPKITNIETREELPLSDNGSHGDESAENRQELRDIFTRDENSKASIETDESSREILTNDNSILDSEESIESEENRTNIIISD